MAFEVVGTEKTKLQTGFIQKTNDETIVYTNKIKTLGDEHVCARDKQIQLMEKHDKNITRATNRNKNKHEAQMVSPSPL